MKVIPRNILLEEIDLLIAKINNLKNAHGNHPEFLSWRKDVEMFLAYIFKNKTVKIYNFSHIKFFPDYFSGKIDEEVVFKEGLEEARKMLLEHRKYLQKNWPEKKFKENLIRAEKKVEGFVFTHYIITSVIIILFFIYIIIFVPTMI
ncbi:MAG: hypothetical protein ACQESP_02850 [Candidatus Muiribacteriota bacterium]